jgi:DNA-binding response OmpR family regulator
MIGMNAPRILVVDDSPFALHWCQSMLGACGMEVSTLENPLLMLKRVREFSPDVVVLDVNMPGINADALVDIMQRRKALEVPVVLHSELPAEQLEVIAGRCGAEWVRKAPDPVHLIKTLERVLRTHRKLRLMVVDDDVGMLRSLERSFRPHAARVKLTLTGSPAEALALALDDPPDAMLVDVYMPGVDGVGVCQKVRAQKSLQAVRLLAMSAAPRHQCPRELLNCADAFLSKPVVPEQVLSLLKGVGCWVVPPPLRTANIPAQPVR